MRSILQQDLDIFLELLEETVQQSTVFLNSINERPTSVKNTITPLKKLSRFHSITLVD